MPVRAVWLNGTVGAGKTTVGQVLAEHVADAGDAVAFINTDDLGVSSSGTGGCANSPRWRGGRAELQGPESSSPTPQDDP